MAQCTHKTAYDFVTGRIQPGTGRRYWRCSVCGREGLWGEEWQYWGNLECRRCGQADIDAVTCSEACRTKYDAMRADDCSVVFGQAPGVRPEGGEANSEASTRSQDKP